MSKDWDDLPDNDPLKISQAKMDRVLRGLKAAHQKHDSVGIKSKPTGDLNIYAKEVWNEAIEAAACQVDGGENAYHIRKLKK